MSAKVLVVEDEPFMREVCVYALQVEGFDVQGVGSCGAAFSALASKSFDALLLDVHLPDGTGWDVLRSLEGSPPQAGGRPPVVMMSAMEPSPERVAVSRPESFLLKPFQIADLVSCLRRALRDPLPVADALTGLATAGP